MFFDGTRDRILDVVYLIDRVPYFADRYDRAPRVPLNGLDLKTYVFRGFGCFLRQLFNFICNNGKALARFPGAYDVLDNVMQSFLCIEAAPTLPPEVSNLPGLEQGWVGTVAITGAFNGAVTFQSSRAFARQAAAIVFKGDAIDDDAARDVIAEITNMLGGNIKSGFATADKEACHLSLPFVSISEVAIPKGPRKNNFTCGTVRSGA